MFDISGWEFLTIAAIGVMIFGPDRLPKLASDAGKFIRQVRSYINTAKADLARELDVDLPDLRNVDLSARGVLKKAMGDEDFESPFADLQKDFRGDLDGLRDDLRAPLMKGDPVSAGQVSAGPVPLEKDETPPWDPDAT